MRRAALGALVGCLLVAAVVLQVSLLARLGLPAATPDLVLVVVVALAYARGPSVGAVVGFAGGLVLDLAPPADHPAGQWALVLTVVGYLAGRTRTAAGAGGAARLGVLAALAAVGTALYAVLSAALGSGWTGIGGLAQLTLASAAYAAALGIAVVPATMWLLDRVEPPRVRW